MYDNTYVIGECKISMLGICEKQVEVHRGETGMIVLCIQFYIYWGHQTLHGRYTSV